MKNKVALITILMLLGILFQLNSFSQSELEINGVMEDQFAIVNDRMVHVGDYIEGFKVLDIKRDYLKFLGKDGIFIKKIDEEKRIIPIPYDLNAEEDRVVIEE